MDIINVYKDSKPYELTEEENNQINQYYNWKNENLPDNEYAGISKNKNLIVIQVESLESFVYTFQTYMNKLTRVQAPILT